MKTKILKTELYVLFALSIISVFYYFFGPSLPDNSLSISSESTNYFSVKYYLSSIFAEISYYVGPWIVVPFLFFSFVYSFILTNRDKSSDPVIGFLIVALFYFITYFSVPKFLGTGLRILTEENISLYTAFFTSLGLTLVVFYMTLRGTFFVLLKRCQKVMERFGYQLITKTQRFTKKSKNLAVTYTGKVKSLDIKTKTKDVLRKQIAENIEKAKAEPEIPTITQRIETPEENKIEEAVIEKEIQKASEANSEEATSVEAQTAQRVVTVESPFFKSNDLIECISEKVNHKQVDAPEENYFKEIISKIQNKLAEFKIDGTIINILKGPVVDTFELEIGPGVKVAKVLGMTDDIGLALSGAPVRMVYPMRGRATIGIEVPRNPRELILLHEVLESPNFNKTKQRLPIAMGKNAFGEVEVVDLAGMPHMLVAGATGAGKSVFINALLVSLIIKKSPRELKLILIDPKQLELALFQDLPHLMLPVVTDPTSSSTSLLWAVQEMERRYTILSKMGVKNIEGFNKKIKTCDPSLLFKINEFYEDSTDEGYDLPYIVIVIDEFADLILSKAGKEIEQNVNRLAAKARAAGIHLVVATQRPSTDVVTGVIKANFPTRVAFRVSTGHDSKTILDQYSAEKLLGKGDMLYKHGVDLRRMHSSFVEENEIEGLIAKLATLPKSFNEKAMEFLENGGDEYTFDDDSPKQSAGQSGTSEDPNYEKALEIVYESGSASASMLQRRLRIGYNRAANLVEEMERNGIVGPAQGSKPRKVLPRGE